jgi:hypothetical protein
MALAARRMFNCREPPVPYTPRGWDDLLKNNQRDFIKQNTEYTQWIKSIYEPTWADYEGAIEEAEKHVSDPHKKRRLREATWQEMKLGAKCDFTPWVASVLYKLKKDEIAKLNKWPRAIGDLGVAASLRGFITTDFMKKSMADNVLKVGKGHMEFCKSPAPRQLEEVFAKLTEPPGSYYFVYFSDDSCLAVWSRGKVYTFNLDISSCDASHTEELFYFMRDITPDLVHKDMELLIEQCKLPIRIVSQRDKRRVWLGKPDHARLYSGSTVTTALNNCAELLIGKAISEVDFDTVTGVEAISDAIISAAGRAGYIITCDYCETPEDIQFLKNSPVRDTTGRLRTILNLGVLARLTGVCRGDLPGSKSQGLELRARIFQHGLLRGVYLDADFELIRRMRANTHVEDKLLTDAFKVKVNAEIENKGLSSGNPFEIEDNQLYRRYRLTPLEIREVNDFMGGSKFGDSIHCSGVAKILEKDYGLTTQYGYDL